MWVILKRGKYWHVMEGGMWRLLAAEHASEKRGEAPTYEEAVRIRNEEQAKEKMQKEEECHAGPGEVDGCAGDGVQSGSVAVDPAGDKAGCGQQTGVRSVAGGKGAGVGAGCAGGAQAGCPLNGEVSRRGPSSPSGFDAARAEAQRESGQGGPQIAQIERGGEENVSRRGPSSPSGFDAARAEAQRGGEAGILPADWARNDDAMDAVEGRTDGLPVFTGETFVRRFPREARALLQLRFVYGFPQREVAKILGCSPQTVRAVSEHALAQQTVPQYRNAAASRLRQTFAHLMEEVDVRLNDPGTMTKTGLKDLVIAVEKIGNKLQEMEGQVPEKPDGADMGAHAAEKEALARDYLARLTAVKQEAGDRGQEAE